MVPITTRQPDTRGRAEDGGGQDEGATTFCFAAGRGAEEAEVGVLGGGDERA